MPRPPAPDVKPVSSSGPSLPLIGGVVVLVVALIGGLVLWAVSRSAGLGAEGSANALPEGGGIQVGAAPADGAPQVQLYEDFQCPWCGVLEQSVGASLSERAEAGEITATYTMMSFLDDNLGNDASHRAANASLCADDAGAFLRYHGAVFAGQPEQEGAGWTDEELIGFAGTAGIEGEALETFTSCFEDDTYGDYVDDMQERANRDGITGTPRMLVDGSEVRETQMQSLMSDPATLEDLLGAGS
ncbi:DsbA family protein [Serinicoccus kebangsaanensis]|uniref:DsbA family protein n=1 Tax=Serinicoccus kebangsaanensis TaxID=2602069 RepID=UPI00124C4C94|nr:thioredoxin domain-containing protein [Serinicoccus kebangsaanensis]